jgi:membrane-bound lytic murein transglycosylase A
VKIGAMSLEEVSLQNIKAWLEANPERMDEVLNYNDSVVYFAKREEAASGALGVVLTPKRSVAIDKRYIPLGSMLYLDAEVGGKSLSQIVLAQDTGGAIKGSVRADLFLGYGAEAMEIAGKLKAPLNLWILLPKKEEL